MFGRSGIPPGCATPGGIGAPRALCVESRGATCRLIPPFCCGAEMTPLTSERQLCGTFLLPSCLVNSVNKNHRDSGAKAIYTDGSKTDEGTGSAYRILENYGIISSWQSKLDRSNSVFQAEILAIRMAIEAVSSLHRPIKIWSDSLPSLMAILYPKSHHSMVREMQTLLLSHKHIHLRWLKAHVGYLGNECADQSAKEATTKDDPFPST
ncbi:hypothetical protein AVEN_51857-1 [Araneus ventricosus]|uniref:RNase H type-1 domain-containing protein n=1 Tax=Araneus ventricosus TaxID=182803 RepID=A0A4Y2IYS7_ARAVE|nr:hypothetical protein AVEN_51857-1 [Araneus ventricosus]